MEFNQVVAEILEALDAAKDGKEHHRLGYSFEGCIHRINLEASFFPSCPVELLPPERRRADGKPNREPWKG
ncbi:TPA: hypothetical protein ACXIJH_000020 [Serratia marcescens]